MSHKASPRISLVLCTVRPDYPYLDHPDWHVLGKVVEDLSKQTYTNFELIIVDGLHGKRDWKIPSGLPFATCWAPPAENYWTRIGAPAISTYRNTGICYSEGSFVINLDDCCVLPEDFVETYVDALNQYGVYIQALTEEDPRPAGLCNLEGNHLNPQVYGFNSFPLDAALQVNGYDLWFDGSQGLEDSEFTDRLARAHVPQGLVQIVGFKLPRQSAHDPRVIRAGVVKCCNPISYLKRNHGPAVQALVANKRTARGYEIQRKFVAGAPCKFFSNDGKSCAYHGNKSLCAYPDLAKNGNKHMKAFVDVTDVSLHHVDLEKMRYYVLKNMKAKYVLR
jgi:hypothetical protein